VALLDVNALVALAWDSHVHRARIREWFASHATTGWATCPVSENGFVRVSSNPKVLPSPISLADAREVLAAQRRSSSWLAVPAFAGSDAMGCVRAGGRRGCAHRKLHGGDDR
jgi:toxin-antitoxin system PIN domain toxin